MDKERKEYLANIRQHRKELVKISKLSGPWDFQYGLDLLVEHIRMMRDFYKKDYNITTVNKESKFEICNRLIKHYEGYFELPEDEEILIAEKYGLELEKIKDNLYIREEGLNSHIVDHRYYDDATTHNFYRDCEDAKEEHWKDFMSLLSEKIREIWD